MSVPNKRARSESILPLPLPPPTIHRSPLLEVFSKINLLLSIIQWYPCSDYIHVCKHWFDMMVNNIKKQSVVRLAPIIINSPHDFKFFTKYPSLTINLSHPMIAVMKSIELQDQFIKCCFKEKVKSVIIPNQSAIIDLVYLLKDRGGNLESVTVDITGIASNLPCAVSPFDIHYDVLETIAHHNNYRSNVSELLLNNKIPMWVPTYISSSTPNGTCKYTTLPHSNCRYKRRYYCDPVYPQCCKQFLTEEEYYEYWIETGNSVYWCDDHNPIYGAC